jgi:hypothetical protein
VYSTDPANLFSQLYDELSERLFAVNEEAESWIDDPSVQEIAADVEHEAVVTGRVSEVTVERLLELESDRNRFAILLGLDRALMQAGLIQGTHDESELVELTLRYLETGRLSTDDVTGAVVPKNTSPGQEHLLPESLRDAFTAVVRVPATTPIAVEHAVLDDWPDRTVREAGLYVAALPAFNADAKLIVERVDAEPPAYRLRLDHDDEAAEWVAERLRALDATRAVIAVLPEMALTPTLLTAWRNACASTPRPHGSRLGWVIAGSGPETDDLARRPRNRAVVVARSSGDIAWYQDKQFRFQLEDDVVKRWGLAAQLGAGPLEEWITVGPRLHVAEAPGFRAAVLICEDLTQLDTIGVTCRDWGVSHAFCPIFSQAIRKFRWERQHGLWLEQAIGLQTIICNSQYIGDVEPADDAPSGDVLALGDTVELAEPRGCLDPIVFRFTEHGVFFVD